MNKPHDWDTTTAATGEGYPQIPKGGYVCKVISAKEEDIYNNRKALVIAFDIAEGEHKDYYKNRFESDKTNINIVSPKWKGIYRLVETTKDGKTNPFLKGFITVVENSNKGYTFDFNEKTLKDKLFGGIFGYEEFMTDNGVRSVVKCKLALSVNKIRNGDFKIPEDVIINKDSIGSSGSIPGFTPVTDNEYEEDIPF